nr:immunoglobulin heavy chain junction region [Mus musculus]MBK4198465.1 immunoglobulin heavy chain junction region [Mus musculus]
CARSYQYYFDYW